MKWLSLLCLICQLASPAEPVAPPVLEYGISDKMPVHEKSVIKKLMFGRNPVYYFNKKLKNGDGLYFDWLRGGLADTPINIISKAPVKHRAAEIDDEVGAEVAAWIEGMTINIDSAIRWDKRVSKFPQVFEIKRSLLDVLQEELNFILKEKAR